MKKILLFLALFSGNQLFAQNEFKYSITGTFFNTESKNVTLSSVKDNQIVEIAKTKLDKTGKYSFKGNLLNSDYYFLRLDDNQSIDVIITRENPEIKVSGDCKNLKKYYMISGSEDSEKLNQFYNVSLAFNQVRDSLVNVLKIEPHKESEINQFYSTKFYEFNGYRQKYVAENQNSPVLLPVLRSINPMEEYENYEAIYNQLVAGFPESNVIKSLQEQHKVIRKQYEEANFLAIGKEAPYFEQADVEGKIMKLSDVKGKVVLIDFWASWCGPCRVENPNVVKLYEKYKDKGFTVFSVSLDRNKEAWLAAIEKDNLKWPYHVSDLKFWSNEVAQLYKVKSIPFTVLVGADGKIINTNIRGVQLEQQLLNIFGF